MTSRCVPQCWCADGSLLGSQGSGWVETPEPGSTRRVWDGHSGTAEGSYIQPSNKVVGAVLLGNNYNTCAFASLQML
ncbi:hypothetical protein EB796_003490 [Bugula neritina]|uniref:Uncharacterized protein n=1 Tax=Bugula neritina TaxID=10212 RepID=A0A7J7KI36_BUGNE|nr:hypothetical protein EB796_003490 [Bugula neritina]